MKRTLTIFAIAVISTIAASAAEIEGYVVDVACSADTVKGGQKAAMEHDKDCALMAPCIKSGYGVLTADNKFIRFDAVGSSKALAAIKATDKKDNLKVKVVGELEANGDSMTVTSISIL
jgi:hypothetical protein